MVRIRRISFKNTGRAITSTTQALKCLYTSKGTAAYGVQQQLENYQFVCWTDVISFYESIGQHLLVQKLYTRIENKNLRRHLYQIIHRTIEYSGNYREVTQGISIESALSPIFGALCLQTLDAILSNSMATTSVTWMTYSFKKHNECINSFMSNRKLKKPPQKRWSWFWVCTLNGSNVGVSQG